MWDGARRRCDQEHVRGTGIVCEYCLWWLTSKKAGGAARFGFGSLMLLLAGASEKSAFSPAQGCK